MPPIIVRTLKREFRLHAPDEAAADALGFMRTVPEIDGPPPVPVDLQVENRHGFLRLVMPFGIVSEGSAPTLIAGLHSLHVRATIDESPGAAWIHGGTISTEAGHILVVGDSGAGKTTLMLHLAASGLPVSGDEHAILDGAVATPRPRTLRVKAGSLRYLAAATAAIVSAAPSVTDWHGAPIHAVALSAFGAPWRISPRKVSHIVLLSANHGGRSRLRRLDPDRALQSLLGNVILPETGIAAALGWLRSVVRAAGCWELWNGRLDDSQRIFYRLCV